MRLPTLALALTTLTLTACDRRDAVPPPAQPMTDTAARTAPAAAPTATPAPIEAAAGNRPESATAAAAVTFEGRMRQLLDHYLAIQTALARDDLAAAKTAAEALSEVADDVEDDGDAEHTRLFASIEAHADNLEDADSIEKARAAFKALSEPMETWAKVAAPDGIDTIHCPMADSRWLQRTGSIENPYHGKEMQACGEVVAGPGMKK